jgi:hypothetical protein
MPDLVYAVGRALDVAERPDEVHCIFVGDLKPNGSRTQERSPAPPITLHIWRHGIFS